jgi:hypothetical protein
MLNVHDTQVNCEDLKPLALCPVLSQLSLRRNLIHGFSDLAALVRRLKGLGVGGEGGGRGGWCATNGRVSNSRSCRRCSI